MNSVEREIWSTVEALNRCWTTGSPGDLREYFHETMVAITPGDSMPLVGREACVSAWTQYAEATTIISWHAHGPRIWTYGRTAVVTYSYAMVCERDGTRLSPSGRDMMALLEDEGRWWVVADHFSPHPGGEDL